MKKIITIYDLDNIKDLAVYVDGFIIGSDLFGTRLTSSFCTAEINDAIKLVNSLNKEIFINANQMFTDRQLDDLLVNLKKINLKDVTGIIVADIGTYQVLAKNNLANKVIYNPETLLTNTFDFNYLASFNTLGAFVAKEITLDDIITIGKNKKYKMFMTGHGHLNMFYSKRQLLNNYGKYTNSDDSYHKKQNLKITEAKRKDKNYPVLEDKAGFHVFRSTVFSSLNYLEELAKVVDYLIIDTLFKDDIYGLEIAKLYSNKIIDKNAIINLQEKYNEQWDEGFLFKKTFYKR